MSRRFDVILCDVDGCLISEAAKPFDLESLAKVAEHNRAAQERGDRPIVTPCSGRPQPFVEAMCRLTANRSVPGIAENGVWLYHPQTNEYIVDPTITESHIAAVHDLHAWVMRRFGPGGAESVGRGVSVQPGKLASVAIYHPQIEVIRGLVPVLTEHLAREYVFEDGKPIFRVSMTERYINCDLAIVSKGTGIDRLFAMTGLRRERVIGIGDMPGDVPIRERCEFFACPANAHEQIKKIADYVSPYEEAHGVLDILARIPG